MGNNGKLFRSAVGGFNRDDVNNYIMKQSREFAEREEKLNDTVSELRAELDTLRLKAEEAEQLRALTAEAEATVRELEDKVRDLEAKLSEEREERSLAEAAVEALSEHCADNEKLKAEAGSIIVNASRAADDMLKRAEDTSKQLVAESERLALEARARVQSTLDKIISDLKEDIQSGTDSCIREFRNYADDITYSSKSLVTELERKYNEMAGKISYYRDTLEESVTGRVEQLVSDDVSSDA